MRLYLAYWKKYRLPFILSVTCVFFEAVCDLLQPTIMAHIIDDGVSAGNLAAVWRLGGMMLLVTGIGMLFAISRNYLSSKTSQSFGADLRYDIFDKVMELSLESADSLGSGSLITRITNDAAQATQFVHMMMRIFFKAPLTCIGSILLAVFLNARLSPVLLVVVAIVTVLIIVSMKLSYGRYSKVQYAMDRVNTVVQEFLLGIRLVKAFGRHEQEENRFEEVNEDLTKKSVSAQRVITVFSPLMSLAVNLGITAVIYIGSLMFPHGSVQVGQIIAFTNYMAQILGSLMMMTNMFNNFVRTKASTQRIQEIFDQADALKTEDKPKTKTKEGVSFSHVSFAYPQGSGEPVLRDLSFQLGPEETLAVIGPTGSGKSTLAWLLLRFYDVTGGAIYFNGTDLRSMEPSELRDRISIAPQQSMLFSGTVAENIKFGRPDATEAEAKAAAETAQADSFIRAMAGGYGSLLGQSGVNVSGGQKQRISIARAVLKNAEVLILDDCTSALDAVTEAKVRKNLKGAGRRQAVIMITQRLGTAMSADKILVLDNGRAAGFGRHEELMASCETYRDIYRSQLGEEGVHA